LVIIIVRDQKPRNYERDEKDSTQSLMVEKPVELRAKKTFHLLQLTYQVEAHLAR
jgi:hypothetical protein